MTIQTILVLLLALLHIYFLVLEMFLWTKPLGLKTFAMTLAKAKDTAVMAANQGLYNGFLASGLIWSVLQKDPVFSRQIGIFFCSCVLVAGVYGAYSVSKKILFVQGLPALITLLVVIFL